jgi:hypothetical protein
MVLGRIFGPKRDEVTEGGENCVMNSSLICTLHQYYNIIRMIRSKRIRWVGACSTHSADERCVQNFGWQA